MAELLAMDKNIADLPTASATALRQLLDGVNAGGRCSLEASLAAREATYDALEGPPRQVIRLNRSR